MRSSLFDSLSRGFKNLPNSEKVRMSENFVDTSCRTLDKLFTSVFAPEIKRAKGVDWNSIKDVRRVNRSSRRNIISLEEEDYLI